MCDVSGSSLGRLWMRLRADGGDEGGVCVLLPCGEDLRSEGEEEARANNSRQDRAPFEGVSMLLDSGGAFFLDVLGWLEVECTHGSDDSRIWSSKRDRACVKASQSCSCLTNPSSVLSSFLFLETPSRLPAFKFGSSHLPFPQTSRSRWDLEILPNF